MSFPIYWTPEKLQELDKLYRSGLSMREVGRYFNKSEWAINSIMRRKKYGKRPAHITRRLQFEKSPLSFKKKVNLNTNEENLKIAGLMLYWGEGGKKQTHCVDFANSDPDMIRVFLHFLREIYQIHEERLRIYLYCHDSQLIDNHINFWSSVTLVPKQQFTKPYVH